MAHPHGACNGQLGHDHDAQLRAAISPIPATMPFQDRLCRLSQELILSDVWKMVLLSHSVPCVPSATGQRSSVSLRLDIPEKFIFVALVAI